MEYPVPRVCARRDCWELGEHDPRPGPLPRGEGKARELFDNWVVEFLLAEESCAGMIHRAVDSRLKAFLIRDLGRMPESQKPAFGA